MKKLFLMLCVSTLFSVQGMPTSDIMTIMSEGTNTIQEAATQFQIWSTQDHISIEEVRESMQVNQNVVKTHTTILEELDFANKHGFPFTPDDSTRIVKFLVDIDIARDAIIGYQVAIMQKLSGQ